jgi:uncharacterized membrane protein YqgA involved in biofilm formation
MVGTLVNTGTVLVGGTVGTLLGDRLPQRVRDTVMHGLGLITLVVGMQMALATTNVLIVLGSVLVGGLLGEWWRIEARLEGLGNYLRSHASRWPFLTRGKFTEGFVTASLVFCVGPMTIMGSIQDGLSGDASTLFLKSSLDAFSSLAFAASLGMGVTCAALTVLLFQGGITLCAGAAKQFFTDPMINEMTAAGGVMLLGLGLLLLDVKRVRVANFLPGLAIAPLIVYLLSLL